MNVYRFNINHNIKNNQDLKEGTILLLGKFNVFHKGHQELLNHAQSIKKDNEKIGIFIIEDERNNFQSLDTQLQILSCLKFDFAIVAKFNYEFKSIEGNNFIKYLDENFFVKEYVVGNDFYFGKDRKYQAKDILDLSKANVHIIPLLKINNQKISSKSIQEMHELGEYNIISTLIEYPLSFDITIKDQKILWDMSIPMPHSGNYFFKLLLEDYWYHGIIRFSLNKTIYFKLINDISNLIILDQKTKIQILNIDRIIINSRFDNITENDIEKAKKYFVSIK